MEGRFEVLNKEKKIKKIKKKREINSLLVVTIINIIILIGALLLLMIPFEINDDSLYIYRTVGAVSLYVALSYFMTIGISDDLVNHGFGFTVFMAFCFVASGIIGLILSHKALFDQSFFANKNSILIVDSDFKTVFFIYLCIYYASLLIIGILKTLFDWDNDFIIILFILMAPIVLLLIYLWLIIKMLMSDEEKDTNFALVLIFSICVPPLGLFVLIIYLSTHGDIDIFINSPSDSSSSSFVEVYPTNSMGEPMTDEAPVKIYTVNGEGDDGKKYEKDTYGDGWHEV